MVQFKIIAVAKHGKTDVLSTPRITVKANQEGKITVGDKKEQDGLFCTAIVKETEGAIAVVATVIVKDKGTEKLNALQTVTLKK